LRNSGGIEEQARLRLDDHLVFDDQVSAIDSNAYASMIKLERHFALRCNAGVFELNH